MISAWDQSEDELQVAQEEAFGSVWGLRPRMVRVNKSTVDDLSRAPVPCFPGVFTNPATSERMRYQQVTNISRNPVLQVRSHLVPGIKQGDQVHRKDFAGRVLESYEVTGIRANGHGTLELDVVQLGLASNRI